VTSLVAVYRRWPDRSAAIAHLEAVRWPDGPECPYCRWPGVSHNRDSSRGSTAERWKCQQCLRSFSVTVGTIFHNSHIDLQRWYLLISLMLNAKKGLSAMQAARDLEMRRPTVWSMMHRIRAALKDDGKLLAGIVEMDEAYVGGKPRRSNDKDDNNDAPRGRGTSKTPVVGAVERGGRLKAKPVKSNEMRADDMSRYTREMVDCSRSIVTTDEYSGYCKLNRFVAHRTINHSRIYLERDMFDDQYGPIHTNTIESAWAILKRAIMGQYHHISRKYLSLYLDEIVYRYNVRHNDGAFDGLLHLAVNP